MKNKQSIKINWLLVAILVLFIILPGGIFIKLASNEINCYLVTMLRYGIVALVTLPFTIRAILNKKQRKLLVKKLPIIATITLVSCVSGPLHTAAIAYSSVSFIEIINLAAPIVFTIISILVTRDKLSRYAVTGLLFAVLGGLVIMVLPTLLGTTGAINSFGWMPLAMQGVVIIMASAWTVYLRRMNESGLSMAPLIGIGFTASFLVSIPLAIADGGTEVFSEISNLSINGWLMIAYLAIVITILSRIIRTKAYEKIGTASYASLDYLYYFMAIAAPIIILGEVLSWEMVIGAILIIIGIILTRKHTHKNKLTKLLHKRFSNRRRK